MNEDVRKKAIGDAPLITGRPADDLAPELDKYQARRIRDYYTKEEDVLSYALFPQVALKYFQYRRPGTRASTPPCSRTRPIPCDRIKLRQRALD